MNRRGGLPRGTRLLGLAAGLGEDRLGLREAGRAPLDQQLAEPEPGVERLGRFAQATACRRLSRASSNRPSRSAWSAWSSRSFTIGVGIASLRRGPATRDSDSGYDVRAGRLLYRSRTNG